VKKEKIASPRIASREAVTTTDDDWPELTGIKPGTETLILGDSVVSGLHGNKMSIDSEQAQVLPISGLDRPSLLAKLKNSRINKTITTIVLHIGINDCKRGFKLGAQTWHTIINHLRVCFPSARVFLSSILPCAHNHPHIESCIHDSNESMQRVSEQLQHVTFINNTAFYTNKGEVKTGWYSDNIHLNKRGSSALAVGIKRTYSMSSSRYSKDSPERRGEGVKTRSRNSYAFQGQRPPLNRSPVHQPSRGFYEQPPDRPQQSQARLYSEALQGRRSSQKDDYFVNTSSKVLQNCAPHGQPSVSESTPQVFPLDLSAVRQQRQLAADERRLLVNLLTRCLF
jgi:hypothetical protein